MPPRLGKYEILERIAIGGMAEIYLARVSGISGFEKLVVVKRILPELATRPEYVRMFLDEARIAASLEHSNIVHVFDVGAEEGQYFFAMEFLHGEDVSTFMQALSVAGRTLPLEAALTIVTGVLAGLHFAHEHTGRDGTPLRIVHRDVSPQNVLVTFDGGVKLLDFGIAQASRRLSATRHGLLKGKVQYMSPEQCRGETVDRRSDVFAAAIMLWELTTSRRLFTGSAEFAIMKRVVETDAPPPSSVVAGYPRALERIVMRGLRRSRGERYQTAQEMQLDLEEFARAERLPTSAITLARLMRDLFGDQLRALDALRQGSGSLDVFRGTAMLRRETQPALPAADADEESGPDAEVDGRFEPTDPAVDADGARLAHRADEAPTAPLLVEAADRVPTAPTVTVDVGPRDLAEPPRRPRAIRWLIAGGAVAFLSAALAVGLARSPRGPTVAPVSAPVVVAPGPPPATAPSPPAAATPAAATQATAKAGPTPPAPVPAARPAAPPRARARGASHEPRRERNAEKAVRGTKKPMATGVNLDTALPP
jgi:serine/threonine protein kinase